MAVLHVNENEFQKEVLESAKPVLLRLFRYLVRSLQNAWTGTGRAG